MVRAAVKLAVFLLVVHALYRSVPVYVRYYQFRDAVKEAALFAKDRSDPEIAERVMALAAEHQVPLHPDYVTVSRDQQKIYIVAVYAELIEWLPSYQRRQQFEISAEGWLIRPVTPGDVIR